MMPDITPFSQFIQAVRPYITHVVEGFPVASCHTSEDLR